MKTMIKRLAFDLWDILVTDEQIDDPDFLLMEDLDVDELDVILLTNNCERELGVEIPDLIPKSFFALQEDLKLAVARVGK